MKTLALLCICFVFVASTPTGRSFFDIEDDDFPIFRFPSTVSRQPQWSFAGFFQPLFSMFDFDPMSDPKTKLYNNTLEEKEMNGHIMTINTSYYINEESGSISKVQSVNVKPIILKKPTSTPQPSLETTQINKDTEITEGNKDAETTQGNKEAENEVPGSTNHESEVEDLKG